MRDKSLIEKWREELGEAAQTVKYVQGYIDTIEHNLKTLFDEVEKGNDNLGEPCGCFDDQGEIYYCDLHLLKVIILGGEN